MSEAQNPDCGLTFLSPACLGVTWTTGDHPSYPTVPPPGYTIVDTPCQHCPAWDAYCEVDEDD